MFMSWGKFEIGNVKPSSKNADFFKFTTGEHLIRIASNIQFEKIHWIEKMPFECTGDKNCKYCRTGDKPKNQYKFIVINRADDLAETMTCGQQFAEAIEEIAISINKDTKGEYSLFDFDIKAKKSGTGMDTKYSASVPIGAKPIKFTSEEIEMINNLKSIKTEEKEDKKLYDEFDGVE